MQMLVILAFVFSFPRHCILMCDSDFAYHNLMVQDQYLDGEQFWTSKSKDVVECATMCLRRKRCFSFNFDINESTCELNANSNTVLQRKEGIFFSEISRWPSQIDPDCYNRPCEEDEVCIPSNLGARTACSYTCIKFYRRCPLPNGIKFIPTRTVGSTFNFTCDHGYVGGDTAVCLPSGQWNKTIDTTCTAVYSSECQDDEVCETINGICSADQNCTCRSSHIYSASKMMCFKDCDDSWLLFGERCYYFGDARLSSTFTEAETFCMNQNASLVEVNTVEELLFLQTEMTTHRHTGSLTCRAFRMSKARERWTMVPRFVHGKRVIAFWMDLYQFGDVDGTERWKTSNNSLDPLDWYVGEPNLPYERCTVFYKPMYNYVDTGCQNTFPVPLCEKYEEANELLSIKNL